MFHQHLLSSALGCLENAFHWSVLCFPTDSESNRSTGIPALTLAFINLHQLDIFLPSLPAHERQQSKANPGGVVKSFDGLGGDVLVVVVVVVVVVVIGGGGFVLMIFTGDFEPMGKSGS